MGTPVAAGLGRGDTRSASSRGAPEGNRWRAGPQPLPPRGPAPGPAPRPPNIRVPVSCRGAAARSVSRGGGGVGRRQRRWRRRWGEPVLSDPLRRGSVRLLLFPLLLPLRLPRRPQPTTTRSCGQAATRTMGRTSGNRPPRPAAGAPGRALTVTALAAAPCSPGDARAGKGGLANPPSWPSVPLSQRAWGGGGSSPWRWQLLPVPVPHAFPSRRWRGRGGRAEAGPPLFLSVAISPRQVLHPQ